MKHLIIGTAGHIDHGKTTLIKALTGVDCDTHPDEKRRGITINLGFTHLRIDHECSVAMVDIPGHKDFISTMVAGCSGIDCALLVVAANEGVMPQTREHLQIMQHLGVRSGIIVLTKIDLTEQERIASVEEECRELVKSTFLEHAEISAVSAKTNVGMAELRTVLSKLVSTTVNREQGSFFRMFIDRVFTKAGYGTVVTGSVLSGVVSCDDTVYVIPRGAKNRIRRIERHGLASNKVGAGDRASLNLKSPSSDRIIRGSVISERDLPLTRLIDAEVTLFEKNYRIGIWTQAIFIIGTFEILVKIHLLDCDNLLGGNSALVQIHLSKPAQLMYEDRFIIRRTDREMTLGGGRIIDPSPLHHRRRPSALIDQLKLLATEGMPRRVANEIRKHKNGISIESLTDHLYCPQFEIETIVKGRLPQDIKYCKNKGNVILIEQDSFDGICKGMLKAITSYHQENPYGKKGMCFSDLTSRLGITARDSGYALMEYAIDVLEKNTSIRKTENGWFIGSEEEDDAEQTLEKMGDLESLIAVYDPRIAPSSEIVQEAKRRDFDEKDIDNLLKQMTKDGKIFAVEGGWLASSTVFKYRRILLNTLYDKVDGITVAGFRDLIKGNRKICLQLFAIYDRQGVITRIGDKRVLTERGRKVCQQERADGDWEKSIR